jgi:kynureninase
MPTSITYATAWRWIDMVTDQFLSLPGIYLLNHSVGRPPRNAQQALVQDFFEPWEKGDADVWPRWLSGIDRFRSALAKLLQGEMTDFCPQTNLSSTLTKLLGALPIKTGRNTILFHESDFPSMGFVVQAAQRQGWQSRMISAGTDPQDLDNWRQFMSDDIGVALVTHVHSNTSAQLPVADIIEVARQRGIISIVDIAQSVGVVPINLSQWQPDFVMGSCVKWLCGGPGAGFLWAHPDAVGQCEPVDLGWFSHAEPFEFDINNFRYADSVLRFWGGTPSVAAFVIAASSIELIAEIGVQDIRRHNLYLNQRIIDALDEKCVVTPVEPELRGGTLVLNFGTRQGVIETRLTNAEVHFDSRPRGLRLSPHIYNTDAEITVVIDCLTS